MSKSVTYVKTVLGAEHRRTVTRLPESVQVASTAEYAADNPESAAAKAGEALAADGWTVQEGGAA